MAITRKFAGILHYKGAICLIMNCLIEICKASEWPDWSIWADSICQCQKRFASHRSALLAAWLGSDCCRRRRSRTNRSARCTTEPPRNCRNTVDKWPSQTEAKRLCQSAPCTDWTGAELLFNRRHGSLSGGPDWRWIRICPPGQRCSTASTPVYSAYDLVSALCYR